MATEVIMPKVDMVMETGTFFEWLKKEGEHVSKGDPLFVTETDKSSIEVESPGDGILAGVRAKQGDVIPVTEVIAYILAPGEALPVKKIPEQVVTIAAPAAVKTPEPAIAVPAGNLDRWRQSAGHTCGATPGGGAAYRPGTGDRPRPARPHPQSGYPGFPAVTRSRRASGNTAANAVALSQALFLFARLFRSHCRMPAKSR